MIDWYEQGIGHFSIWYCNFYGEKIFLCVSDIDNTTGELLLYELKTVKYGKNNIALSYDKRGGCFRPKDRQDCLIANVIKPNCYTNPTIRKKPIKVKDSDIIVLEHKIEPGTNLYKLIKKIGFYKEGFDLTLHFQCIGTHKDYQNLINSYWKKQYDDKMILQDEEEVFEA